MKSLYSRLNIIITVFFVLGILFSAFNLYNLPAELEKVSGRIDLSIIKELNPVLSQTYFIIGLTLVLGLASIILALYLLNYTKSSEKIIYVEKTDSQKEQDEKKDEQSRKENLTKEIINIQSGISELKDRKEKYEKVLSKLCMKIDASQGLFMKPKKKRTNDPLNCLPPLHSIYQKVKL